MRALLQELDQQIRKQHEALQILAHAPVESRLDVLRTPLAAYQKARGMAETVTRQGLEQVQQTAEQMQQAISETSERNSEWARNAYYFKVLMNSLIVGRAVTGFSAFE